MMHYADVEEFIRAGLAAKGYSTANPDVSEGARTMPVIGPGPSTIQDLWKKSPSAMVFATVGNGGGLRKEGLFDTPFITVRVIGLQNDFGYAETLAYDLDDLFLGVDSNTMIGSVLTLFINRTGGAPQLVDFDSANRYHFQTTYIAEVQR